MPNKIKLQISGLSAIVRKNQREFGVVLCKSQTVKHYPLLTFGLENFISESPASGMPNARELHYTLIDYKNHPLGIWPIEGKSLRFALDGNPTIPPATMENRYKIADAKIGNNGYHIINPECFELPCEHNSVSTIFNLLGGTMKVKEKLRSKSRMRWYNDSDYRENEIVEERYAEVVTYSLTTEANSFEIISENLCDGQPSNILSFNFSENNSVHISIGNHPALPDEWKHSRDVYDIANTSVPLAHRKVPVLPSVWDEFEEPTEITGPLTGGCSPVIFYVPEEDNNDHNS